MPMQLIKFESKSNRVKGLSFHPKRPWILASLHNGVIQLLDYRMGTLLERFEEHEGPVRGVHFHCSQPLFVSGGDDYKIKVWDYNLRRCSFTLTGHLDYVRTVQFHHENPWIVSASDDQTIRIWNWMSRSCISVLTGHNHYVMCAQFHPRDEYIVSASLDQTVRVWDTSGLRKKTVRGMGSSSGGDSLSARVNNDFFGGNDAVVKYVMENHERGANWASFHPTMPLVVSGADDRLVKLWRMGDIKAWETETFRGHLNNVSCVIFHPKDELIISNSEDRTIRVWDMSGTSSQTFRREHDRFWILAAHPEANLLAAGHDGGMMVFKLERERLPYVARAGQLMYVKDRYLRRCVLGTGADVPLVGLRRPARFALNKGPHTLEHNPYNNSEDNLLLYSTTDGGTFELFRLNTPEMEPIRGRGVAAAVFIGRSKFMTLDNKLSELAVRSLDNTIKRRFRNPAGVNGLMSAGRPGRVLFRTDDKLSIFEPASLEYKGEISANRAKYVCWNKDSSLVAIMGKNYVILADAELNSLCVSTETVRVKGGVWDDMGVFVYTTSTHVKYLLAHKSGEGGILRTLDHVMYPVECHGDTLHCLDRQGKTRQLKLDRTECRFKKALMESQYDVVLEAIQTGRLCGDAVVSYLQRNGYAEVALQFVTDPQTRFDLALEYGNLQAALEAANVVNTTSCWHRLATEGLRQGNHQMVTMAYQNTQNFDRLSFLYLITGNLDDLRLMLKIAGMRSDVMAQFHNSLYLGDVPTRVGLLEGAGQTALAYLTAATHGMAEEAERLAALLTAQGLPLPATAPDASYLMPPTPLLRETNWPLLEMQASVFDRAAMAAQRRAAAGAGAGVGAAAGDVDAMLTGDVDVGAWDEMDPFAEMDGAAGAGGGDAAGDAAAAGTDAWGDDLDLGDLDAELGAAAAAAAPAPAAGGAGAGAGAGRANWRTPAAGHSAAVYWGQNSNVPADHVAAGAFERACQLLTNQIGVTNFEPLRPFFAEVFAGAQLSMPMMPSWSPLALPFSRSPVDAAPPGAATLPAVCITLASLHTKLKSVFTCFQSAKFDVAATILDELLHRIPLAAVSTKQEVLKIKELLRLCQEYRLAVGVELARRGTKMGTPAALIRVMELSAYFTHCNLKPPHLALALNLAMAVAYKAQNFITAAGFARRLLELPEALSAQGGKLAARARNVLTASEAKGRNAHKINYDERNPFVLDARNLVPIYRGSAHVTCPYCGSAHSPADKGSLCAVCNLATVGLDTLGLVVAASKQ